jgi:hypothetical protein
MLFDTMKPLPSDARIRLGQAGAAFAALIALSYLLPIPSPLESIYAVTQRSPDVNNFWFFLCAAGWQPALVVYPEQEINIFTEGAVLMVLSLTVIGA